MNEHPRIAALEAEWLARFGEPLPMRTDVELIEGILADARPAEPQTWEG